jgi:cytochrome c556
MPKSKPISLLLVLSLILLIAETVKGYKPFSFNVVTARRFALSTMHSDDSDTLPPDKSNTGITNQVNADRVDEERTRIQKKLFGLAAACDRGFGATKKDREEIQAMVNQLVDTMTGTEPMFTEGLSPDRTTVPAMIEGVWKLVYTDAFDVLSLAASPFTLLQGIYQVIESSGRSVNVIDLSSRVTPLLPLPFADRFSSILRLKVFTEASARTPTRVGLQFRKVEAAPIELLGFKNFPFPPFQATLPQATLVDAAQATVFFSNNNDLPGFFDVLYLDKCCLVIKQNAPGGIFVSIRSEDPTSLYLS